jgi:hypothetical protein
MSILVHNEQTKALATLCNNFAVAASTAGVIVPVFSPRGNLILLTAPAGIMLALCFVWLSQSILRKLKD